MTDKGSVKSSVKTSPYERALVGSFKFPSQNIPVEQFPGDPCAKFVIPEFPTLIAWIVVIMVPSSVALFASKKIRPKVN